MARQQSKSVLLYSGVNAQTLEQQEASNLSANAWYAGDLVHITDSGYATIATGLYILGIAVTAASGTDYADFDVELLDFYGLYTITAEADTATARANLGACLQITYTAGAHVVGTTTTTSVIHLVGIYNGNDDVTDGGKYIVRFDATTVLAGSST